MHACVCVHVYVSTATPRGLSPTGSFHSLPGAPDTDTPPHHSASLPELTRQTNSVGPSTSTKPPLDTHNKPPLSARDSSASTGTLLAQATHHPHMHHSASASTVGSMGGQGGGGGGGFLGLGALRRRAAATAQQLTSQWVDSLARTPLQLIVDMTSFEGTVMVFLSPPPSDRYARTHTHTHTARCGILSVHLDHMTRGLHR